MCAILQIAMLHVIANQDPDLHEVVPPPMPAPTRSAPAGLKHNQAVPADALAKYWEDQNLRSSLNQKRMLAETRSPRCGLVLKEVTAFLGFLHHSCMILQMVLEDCIRLAAVPATKDAGRTKGVDCVGLSGFGKSHQFRPGLWDMSAHGPIRIEGLATTSLNVAPQSKMTTLNTHTHTGVPSALSWMEGCGGSKSLGRACWARILWPCAGICHVHVRRQVGRQGEAGNLGGKAGDMYGDKWGDKEAAQTKGKPQKQTSREKTGGETCVETSGQM